VVTRVVEDVAERAAHLSWGLENVHVKAVRKNDA
jgi:hypothetical protein